MGRERGIGREREWRDGGTHISGVNSFTELVGASRRDYFSQNTLFSIFNYLDPHFLIYFSLVI